MTLAFKKKEPHLIRTTKPDVMNAVGSSNLSHEARLGDSLLWHKLSDVFAFGLLLPKRKRKSFVV